MASGTSMMDEVFRDKDEAKNDRFMAALVKMKKLELEPLTKAFAGVI